LAYDWTSQQQKILMFFIIIVKVCICLDVERKVRNTSQYTAHSLV
jgi:hypothetical protein